MNNYTQVSFFKPSTDYVTSCIQRFISFKLMLFMFEKCCNIH